MEVAGKWYLTYPSRTNTFEIWNLADLHLMNKGCAEDEIREDVEKIRTNPYAYWVGGGDYVDYIGYTDKRFDPDSISPDVTVADLGRLGKAGMDRAVSILSPIKDRCLGLLYGNHELSFMKDKQQQQNHGWLCTELGVINLGYCAFFDVIFERIGILPFPVLSRSPQNHGFSTTWSQRFFVHHGSGFATTPAGKLNRLLQFMNAFDADIYMCGHVHDQKGQRIIKIGANADCTKLIAHNKIGVISGSYLKTYQEGVTSYGEQRGYSPTVLGSARVFITPDKGEVKGEI